MAGPKIPWKAGRIDGFAKDVTPDGRLPDATQGADHLRNVSQLLQIVTPYLSNETSATVTFSFLHHRY